MARPSLYGIGLALAAAYIIGVAGTACSAPQNASQPKPKEEKKMSKSFSEPKQSSVDSAKPPTATPSPS